MANADSRRVRRYQKPSCDSAIVPQENSLHQYFLLVKQNQLTEIIEALEKRGLTGDLAVFVLANLQSLEGR